MDRRSFLTMLGGATAYAVIAAPSKALPTIPSRPEARLESASSWIAFNDGRYELFIPRVEIGQNISTGFKKIASVELGVSPDQISVSYADTHSIDPFRATVSSESVQDFALPLAIACAALRDAVAEGRTGRVDAVERPYESLKAFQSGALDKVGELVGGKAIVTGAPLFASDVRLPGMLFGRVLRADASPEIASRPIRWDETAAAAEAGFIKLVEDNLSMNNSEGLGIVAKTPGGLDRIAAALDVEWSVEETPDGAGVDSLLDIDRRRANGDADYDLADDRIDDSAPWDVDIRIDTPFAAHSAMEPRVAVADVKGRAGRIWVGTQDPFYVHDMLVDDLDFREDELTVIPQRVGGGFGGKAIPLVEMEAAALSRAAEAPVKVQWTRARELTHAYHRPPTSHRIKARVNAGRVQDWNHRISSGHVIFSNAVLPAWMQTFTDFIGDDGAARNATPPYSIAAQAIGYDLERLPIRTGAWRGLGAGPNALAVEMAMEQCALRAGQSPVEFRLSHIEDPRLATVLQAVAKIAGPAPASGRGVGCGIYKGVSYGAVIADMVMAADGSPVVKKLYAAHDCGKVIDADQVKAQCEGNMIWSLGLALTDKLTLRGGTIQEKDFIDAPIPTITDAPEMEVTLIETDAPPVGAGETLMAAAPAAIVNGYTSLTGSPPRRLPIRV